MTSIRLQKRHEDEAQWAGRCRHSDCSRPLRVKSEAWQNKIEVLSALREHPARKKGHLHGTVTVHGYKERGGE